MKFITADRLKQVKEYYFSQKLEQIAEMKNNGIDVINLGIGSPDLPPPDSAIKKALKSLKLPDVHRYATYRSMPELRQAISDWYLKTYQVKLLSQNQILPLLGSKEGIFYLSMALLNPGDKVLIPNPGYPTYSSVAKLLNVQIVYYDLTEKNHWLPDLKKIKTLDLKNCKLMWVNYPHMPTGAVATEKCFKELVSFAFDNNIVLCNDNPYSLVLNQQEPLSLLKFDPKLEVSTELNSLSKSFNMAGWRVGMFLGSKEVVDAVISVKSNVDSGMFQPIQLAAIEALKADDKWHKNRNKIYQTRRKYIWEIFNYLNLKYSQEQVGLFVWGKAPDSIKDVEKYVDTILLKAHVFFTPGSIFGSNGDRFIRASLCAPIDVLKKALKKIKEFSK